MKRSFKLLHFLGFAIFLGSILIYIFISYIFSHQDFIGLIIARKLILTGTIWFTLPALWSVTFTGIVLAIPYWKNRNNIWLKIKLGFVFLIFFNTHFLILPAIKRAYFLR